MTADEKASAVAGNDEGGFVRFCRAHGLRPDEERRRQAAERASGSEDGHADGRPDSLALVRRRGREVADDEDLMRVIRRNVPAILKLLGPGIAAAIVAVLRETEEAGRGRR